MRRRVSRKANSSVPEGREGRMPYVLVALLGILGFGGCAERPDTTPFSSSKQPVQVDFEKRTVRVAGRIYPRRYNEARARARGHHGIVWEKGSQARKALIEVEAPDVEIQRALESLGLEPGNNLTIETWEAAGDAESSEPDRRVEGPAIQIEVEWEEDAAGNAAGEKRAVPFFRLFEDTGPEDMDIRFGGHEEYVPHWRSGCVTCLFSCPGGRTSNAAFVIRDQVKGRREFRANQKLLPGDGARVRVLFGEGE